MMFAARLRPRIRSGEITTSVRIWRSPRVKVGNRYPMDEGAILVEALEPISLDQVTGELARRSGFQGVVDLLKTARHGAGERIFLVTFRYLPPG